MIDPEYHYEALNVEGQQSNPNSLLWWTKRLIALRKRYRAFGRGAMDFLHPANPHILAFVRRLEEGDDREVVLVVANLSRHVQFVELDLSSFKGAVPVELMGRTRFPSVANQPYMLTLGGHDFYWFSLEAPRATADERRSVVGPMLLHCSSTDALLFGDERSLVEDALPSFLDARGLIDAGIITSARIADVVRVATADPKSPIAYVFIRVEYVEKEAESFALPLQIVFETPTATSAVASVSIRGDDAPTTAWLVEATTETASRALVELAARGGNFQTPDGRIVGEVMPDASLDVTATGEGHVVSTDALGAAIAFGENLVLKLLYRLEEGTAPELEVARVFQRGEAREAKRRESDPGMAAVRPSMTSIGGRLSAPAPTRRVTPRVVGWVERRAGRNEPRTLALIEEYVVNEGTAWKHARSEIGRAYERVIASPAGTPTPVLPRTSLLELAALEPPDEHREVVGAYRDWATRLGSRTAELHVALSTAPGPAFEPVPYTTMDQRSKYQSARNIVGRGLANLKRQLADVPPNARDQAARLVSLESAVLARFELILSNRIDSSQIRTHGDLHLGRVLFTGRDFVILGIGGARSHHLSERRRKRGALRDVASMLRSFHYATSMSLGDLRPEDQAKAAPWGWIWQAWAAAAFLRGYLEGAKDAVFVPSATMLQILLDAAILEAAFLELRSELGTRPDRAWIPIEGILRMLTPIE